MDEYLGMKIEDFREAYHLFDCPLGHNVEKQYQKRTSIVNGKG